MPTFWEELKAGDIIELGDQVALSAPMGIEWKPLTDKHYGIGVKYDPSVHKIIRRKVTI